MNFKKAICQLWGHDFVLTSGPFYRLEDENKAECSRCGKPKYITFNASESNEETASTAIFQNFNYMNNRQEFRAPSRTLN